MSTAQIHAFDSLLDNWSAHHQLRKTGASIAELNDSRLRLDEARAQAHSAK